MTKRIRVPKTIDEAVTSLAGIEALLTAKGWERAAIVYAFTFDAQGSNQHQKKLSDARLGIAEFAALGIAGLTSAPTVRTYRTLWAEHGDPEIGPGSIVTLPELDFPPQDRNLGSRMPSDPEKAIAQMVDQHGAGGVVDAMIANKATHVAVVETIAHDRELFHEVLDIAVPLSKIKELPKREWTEDDLVDEINVVVEQLLNLTSRMALRLADDPNLRIWGSETAGQLRAAADHLDVSSVRSRT